MRIYHTGSKPLDEKHERVVYSTHHANSTVTFKISWGSLIDNKEWNAQLEPTRDVLPTETVVGLPKEQEIKLSPRLIK